MAMTTRAVSWVSSASSARGGVVRNLTLHKSNIVAYHYTGGIVGYNMKGTIENPEEQIMATVVEEEVALALEWQCVPRDEMRQRVDAALKVMDLTAFALCDENNLPIYVFDMNRTGNLLRVVEGEEVGTLVCK